MISSRFGAARTVPEPTRQQQLPERAGLPPGRRSGQHPREGLREGASSGPQPVQFPRGPGFRPAAACLCDWAPAPDRFRSSGSARRGRPPPAARPSAAGGRCGRPGTSAAAPRPRRCDPAAGRIRDASGPLLGEQVRANDLVSTKRFRHRGLAQMVPSCRSGRSIRRVPDERFVRKSAGQSPHRWPAFSVVVLGGKGGVGKTSSTVVISSRSPRCGLVNR